MRSPNRQRGRYRVLMNGSALHGDGFRVVVARRRFVVVDKPAGLLSVPGIGSEKADCAASRVAAMFPDATGPLVCHRLDMATSGLLVFGLDADAQRLISLQFQRRRVVKRYEALLRGEPETQSGRVTLPLMTDWPNRPMQKVDHEMGKRAETLWQVIERISWQGQIVTRVEMMPITGKTHQLRVHAVTPSENGGIGCPIVGDEIYDSGFPSERLMLHARSLEFTDPETLRRVRVLSTVPF